MTRLFFLTLSLGLTFFNVNAQQQCGSTLDLSNMQANEPERYQRFMNLENFTATFSSSQNNVRLINQNGLIIIPVVVHVLHRGEAIGTGLNISLAQIQSQLDVLNEDFRRLNADAINTPSPFANVASDFSIEFRLACFDPNGNSTDGVVRKYTSVQQFTLGANEVNTGIKVNPTGSVAWDPNRYLNIWVCNLSNATLGYGTWPADFITAPQYDGIVVRTNAFGRIGNVAAPNHLGRTATHEVGHWLNLRHIWGDTYCGNDFVNDTPTQGSFTTACPSNIRISCNNGPDGDMYMNYMDYVSDACYNLFTNGQRTRSRAIFAQGRERYNQLEGFFGFQGQPTSINCKGKITVSPMCLPVTWTVTGPATITAGAGTSQIELTATGAGTVSLVATSGNYTSNTTINVTAGSAPNPTSATLVQKATRTGEKFALYSIEPNIPNAQYIVTPSVQDNTYYYVYGNEVEIIYPCEFIPGEFEATVKIQNECGIGANSVSISEYFSPCGGPRDRFILTVSPNPTSQASTLKIVPNTQTKSSELMIRNARIINRFGLVVKEFSFSNKSEQQVIDVSSLPFDSYIVQVFNGEVWISAKLLKNR